MNEFKEPNLNDFNSWLKEVTPETTETKVCTKCGITKLAFEMNTSRGYPNGHCKDCHDRMLKGTAKAKKNQPRPGPNHKCEACQRTGDEIVPKNKWCADHNHTTGAFRGWICQGCNLSLGYMKDDTKKT